MYLIGLLCEMIKEKMNYVSWRVCLR